MYSHVAINLLGLIKTPSHIYLSVNYEHKEPAVHFLLCALLLACRDAEVLESIGIVQFEHGPGFEFDCHAIPP